MAHRHPDGAAVQRVGTPGSEDHPVHAEPGGVAEDRAEVLVVVDALQHGDGPRARRITSDTVSSGARRAAPSTPRLRWKPTTAPSPRPRRGSTGCRRRPGRRPTRSDGVACPETRAGETAKQASAGPPVPLRRSPAPCRWADRVCRSTLFRSRKSSTRESAGSRMAMTVDGTRKPLSRSTVSRRRSIVIRSAAPQQDVALLGDPRWPVACAASPGWPGVRGPPTRCRQGDAATRIWRPSAGWAAADDEAQVDERRDRPGSSTADGRARARPAHPASSDPPWPASRARTAERA